MAVAVMYCNPLSLLFVYVEIVTLINFSVFSIIMLIYRHKNYGLLWKMAKSPPTILADDSYGHNPQMAKAQNTEDRDIQILAAIKRGPGQYPTPSPERVQRLIEKGLVRKERGSLRPTLKGRLVSLLYRLRGVFSR